MAPETTPLSPPRSRKSGRLLPAVLIAPLFIMATAHQALAQQSGEPTLSTPARSRQVSALPGDILRRYVEDGGSALNLNILASGARGVSPDDSLQIQRDIVYNIKYWHMVLGAGLLCDGRTYAVSGVQLLGVHFFDNATKATAYYTATTVAPQPGATRGEAGDGDSRGRCAEASLELSLVRLVDGDLYAPDWGRRLVRRR